VGSPNDLVRTTAQLVATARGSARKRSERVVLQPAATTCPVTTPDRFRSAATSLHVDRILGVGELALSDHRSKPADVDELLRIASEAHVAV